MRTLVPVLIACAVLVVGGCGGSGGGGSSDSLETQNSGVAVINFNGSLANLLGQVLFAASEFGQAGLDLNGDGDAADNVIHQVDPATGTISNLGVSGTMPFVTGDTRVAWLTSEVTEGNQDVTGDGDSADTFLVVHSPLQPPSATNPRITGVNAMSGSPIAVSGDVFAFVSFEFELAAAPVGPASPPYTVGVDLNGDGDFNDRVVRIYDPATDTVVNTGLAWGGGVLAGGNGFFIFTVSEEDEGDQDLNLDGDEDDFVAYEYQIATQTTRPVGPGGAFPRAVNLTALGVVGTPAAPVLVYAVDEENEGMTSFNFNPFIGDTDAQDFVLATYDPLTQTETFPFTGIAIDPLQIAGNETRLAFVDPEEDNGVENFEIDFNVDGDTEDQVPFWIDLNTPSIAVNSGVASVIDAAQLQVCEQYMIFRASEADQGPNGTNLNAISGDTDTSDAVAYYFDISAPGIPAVSTQTAVTGIICFDGLFFILADETANGGEDVNSDGDTDDVVPVYYRVEGANLIRGNEPIINDGFLGFQVCPTQIRIFGNASEDRGFGDKNGDGDTDDYFLLVTRISVSSGDVISNLSVGGTDDTGDNAPFVTDADAVFYPRVEAIDGTGGVNRNSSSGDVDTSDTILFWVNTSCE